MSLCQAWLVRVYGIYTHTHVAFLQCRYRISHRQRGYHLLRVMYVDMGVYGTSTYTHVHRRMMTLESLCVGGDGHWGKVACPALQSHWQVCNLSMDILADMYTWFYMCELDSFLHSVYAIIWYVAGASAAMFHLHGFTMTQAGSGATMLERRQWSGKTIIYIIKWYLQYHWKSCPMWRIWHVPVCRLHMIWHGFLSN